DLEVTNYGLTDAQLRLEWEVSADFAGLVEQRSGKRQQNAPVDSAWRSTDGGGELRFDYLHPQLQRGVLLRLLLGAAEARPRWDAMRPRLPVRPYCCRQQSQRGPLESWRATSEPRTTTSSTSSPGGYPSRSVTVHSDCCA